MQHTVIEMCSYASVYIKKETNIKSVGQNTSSNQNRKNVNANESFGYVTGLKNSFFDANKVFKTNVTAL